MKLDPIIAGLVKKLSSICKALDYLLDLILGPSVWLCEANTHELALELDITRRNGIRL